MHNRKITQAIILAAGYGKRLLPLTKNIPKPLIQLGKYKLIEHHLYKLAKIGVTHVVVNCHYLAQQIQQTLQQGQVYGLKITYSYEPEILGVGGGVVQAINYLQDDLFYLLSADIYSNFNYADLQLLANYQGELLLVENPAYYQAGDFYINNNILGLQGTHSYTFAGIALLSAQLFAQATPGYADFLPFAKAVNARQITGKIYSGVWYNIGTKEELALASNAEKSYN